MELNITKFFNEACPRDYFASVAEIGVTAQADTWRAACDDSNDFMLLDNEEKREAFRHWVKGFGAWDDEEILAWSSVELNALCIQVISGEIREFQELAEGDWQKWRELCDEGTCSGRLYGGELSVDGQVYFSIED